MIQVTDFEKVDIRVGKIITAEYLDNARYSTHRLVIDFGPDLGQKKSCARLVHYAIEELIDRHVLAVVNFPPRQIGKNISEVLTLGVPGEDGECVLISPDAAVPVGGKLY